MIDAFGVERGDISKSKKEALRYIANRSGGHAGKGSKNVASGQSKSTWERGGLQGVMIHQLTGKSKFTGPKGEALAVTRVKGSPADIKALAAKKGINAKISKGDPPTPNELRHKKKVSAATSIAGSTLGIAGLGAMLAGKGLPKVAGKLVKLPQPKKSREFLKDPRKVKARGKKIADVAGGLSVGATGVGGIGGFNYAAIQRAEARKKRI